MVCICEHMHVPQCTYVGWGTARKSPFSPPTTYQGPRNQTQDIKVGGKYPQSQRKSPVPKITIIIPSAISMLNFLLQATTPLS